MKVLITGITGFVGSHIAKGFLDRNWDVVGTVRSAAKGDALKTQPAFSSFPAEKLRFIVVEHLENYDFSSDLKDVDAIAHTASPCHMDGEKIEQYTIPAIEGTSKLLMAARDSPTVKAVAVTSSFGAMLNPHKTALEQGDKIYTEKDWFSMTIEEAANRNVHFWYATAKTLAEQKAWQIKNLEGTKWSLATICPPSIYGPVIHTTDPSRMNMTSRRLYDFFFGQIKDVMETKYPAFIDVRDVADAHIEAIRKETTGRFLTSAGFYDLQRVAHFVHEKFGKAAELTPQSQRHNYLSPEKVYSLDSSEVVKVLKLSMKSFKETFGDTFKNYLKIYQNSKSSES